MRAFVARSGLMLALAVGAFGIARFFAAAFPGMHTDGAPTFIGATVLLIAIAQLASYIPARHASRISPTEALRAE